MSDLPAADVTVVTATARTDAGRLHSIGDVARLLAMPHHVLRYWEQRLPQLRPVKRAGGRRYYRDADVAMIRLTRDLVERQGYRLDAAARVAAQQLAGSSAGDPALLSDTHDDARIVADRPRLSSADYASLRRLRDQLARALAA